MREIHRLLTSCLVCTVITLSSGVKDRQRDDNSSGTPHNTSMDIYPGFTHRILDDIQVGCQELRSKRYISDGFCTSIKPITEVVCTGHCLPIRNLPWYAEFIKIWARYKTLEWRCVENVVKRRHVRLMCKSGESRTYKIKVVKSCKCKKYFREQNTSYTTISSLDDDIVPKERKRDKHRRKNKHEKRRRRKDRRREKSKEETEISLSTNSTLIALGEL